MSRSKPKLTITLPVEAIAAIDRHMSDGDTTSETVARLILAGDAAITAPSETAALVAALATLTAMR